MQCNRHVHIIDKVALNKTTCTMLLTIMVKVHPFIVLRIYNSINKWCIVQYIAHSAKGMYTKLIKSIKKDHLCEAVDNHGEVQFIIGAYRTFINGYCLLFRNEGYYTHSLEACNITTQNW